MVRSMQGRRQEYFEAILQLRDTPDEVYEFALQELDRAGIHIAKDTLVRGGRDLYIADNKFGKQLGKTLQQKFGGEVIVTASLYGQKNGEEIFRLTILFRPIPFKKNDTVLYKGEEYVVKVVGKELLLQHTKTGQKAHVKYREMGRMKVLSH